MNDDLEIKVGGYIINGISFTVKDPKENFFLKKNESGKYTCVSCNKALIELKGISDLSGEDDKAYVCPCGFLYFVDEHGKSRTRWISLDGVKGKMMNVFSRAMEKHVDDDNDPDMFHVNELAGKVIVSDYESEVLEVDGNKVQCITDSCIHHEKLYYCNLPSPRIGKISRQNVVMGIYCQDYAKNEEGFGVE